MSFIYYANEQGEFIGIDRQGSTPVLWLLDKPKTPKLSIYNLDPQGNRTNSIESKQYEPRPRPWYRKAVEVGKQTWSPIYLDFVRPILVISPVVPIYRETGELRGVLAIDLTLEQISDFLRSLKISESGQAFIIEQSGEIIASSAPELPFVSTQQGRKRLNATSSSNPLIKSAAQHLQQKFGSLNRIEGSQQLIWRC